MNKKGFTLVELLVVVLIIGVLTSVALPMYQGAVDKSHFSTMLPVARAIKNAEEAFMMANGVYTSDPTELDVSLNDNNVSYVLETSNDEGKQFNVVRLTNSKLPNVRLSSYFDDNTAMAGQLHCEAKTSDERAERLCSKLLKGEDLTTTDGGYTGYLLDQEVDKTTCDNVGRIWSNKNTKCFKTEQERCTANGMPYSNGICGCSTSENGCSSRSFTEAKCMTSSSGCSYNSFTEAECTANGSDYYIGGCTRSVFDHSVCNANSHSGCASSSFTDSTCNGNKRDGCQNSKFYQGSICISKEFYACGGSTFYEGSKCVANINDGVSCQRDVKYEGGCCEGPYCPSNAPKCQD